MAVFDWSFLWIISVVGTNCVNHLSICWLPLTFRPQLLRRWRPSFHSGNNFLVFCCVPATLPTWSPYRIHIPIWDHAEPMWVPSNAYGNVGRVRPMHKMQGLYLILLGFDWATSNSTMPLAPLSSYIGEALFNCSKLINNIVPTALCEWFCELAQI